VRFEHHSTCSVIWNRPLIRLSSAADYPRSRWCCLLSWWTHFCIQSFIRNPLNHQLVTAFFSLCLVEAEGWPQGTNFVLNLECGDHFVCYDFEVCCLLVVVIAESMSNLLLMCNSGFHTFLIRRYAVSPPCSRCISRVYSRPQPSFGSSSTDFSPFHPLKNHGLLISTLCGRWAIGPQNLKRDQLTKREVTILHRWNPLMVLSSFMLPASGRFLYLSVLKLGNYFRLFCVTFGSFWFSLKVHWNWHEKFW